LKGKMAVSTAFQIPLLAVNQAQKETTVNAAFTRIDAALSRTAKDKDLNNPTGLTPADGDIYIVGPSSAGIWAAKSNQIAFYASGWNFIQPVNGMAVFVQDESLTYYYNGTNWTATVSNLSVALLGVNTNADATNKLASRAAATLLFNDAGSHNLKLSKSSAGNTASVIFQNAFSGRAEFGLIGSDNFKLKTSPDGTTFSDITDINPTTKQFNFSQAGSAGAPPMIISGDLDTGFYYIGANTWGFAAGGAEIIRLSPSGISYNAGTTFFNDYETGTFTPALQGGATSGSPTYTNQIGDYIRDGDQVFYDIRLNLSAIGGMTGDIRLINLPFTTKSGTQFQSANAPGIISGNNLADGKHLTAVASGGLNYATLRVLGIAGGSADAQHTDITNSLAFRLFLRCRI
jgi:hypothetical protein